MRSMAGSCHRWILMTRTVVQRSYGGKEFRNFRCSAVSSPCAGVLMCFYSVFGCSFFAVSSLALSPVSVPWDWWHAQLWFFVPSIFDFDPQLRVVRAFKSTLEDIEDRRSSHSVPSVSGGRTGRGYLSRPYSYVDIPYVDDTKHPAFQHDLPYENYLARQATLPEIPESPRAADGDRAAEQAPLLAPAGRSSPQLPTSSSFSLNNNRP